MDYTKNVKEYFELVKASSQATEKFFRHCQLLTASVLSVLVALSENTQSSLYIRLAFFLLILLLALALVTSTIVLYDLTNLRKRMMEEYHDELQAAQALGCTMSPLFVLAPKREKICRRLSYIFWLSAIINVVVYTFLKLF
ncbi:MAG: hypothetical protein R3Y59_02815 [bacterium]